MERNSSISDLNVNDDNNNSHVLHSSSTFTTPLSHDGEIGLNEDFTDDYDYDASSDTNITSYYTFYNIFPLGAYRIIVSRNNQYYHSITNFN